MKHILIAAALALAACSPGTDPIGNGTVSTVTQAVQLRSTTALSLAERAFNAAEAGATAALRSGHLSKEQAASLGTAVHHARDIRDEARTVVAKGQDATAIIERLNAALATIDAIKGA